MIEAAARRRRIPPHLLAALASVDRAPFVLPEALAAVTRDEPLPIGGGHHHAEPSFLAHLLALAGVGPGTRVAVLGAGSGYLAALAAAAGAQVLAIERDPVMVARARSALAGHAVEVLQACVFDWTPSATFDALVFGGAVTTLGPWLDRLAPEGVLVAPVGDERHQELVTLVFEDGAFQRRGHGAVRSVPLSRATGGR